MYSWQTPENIQTASLKHFVFIYLQLTHFSLAPQIVKKCLMEKYGCLYNLTLLLISSFKLMMCAKGSTTCISSIEMIFGRSLIVYLKYGRERIEEFKISNTQRKSLQAWIKGMSYITYSSPNIKENVQDWKVQRLKL